MARLRWRFWKLVRAAINRIENMLERLDDAAFERWLKADRVLHPLTDEQRADAEKMRQIIRRMYPSAVGSNIAKSEHPFIRRNGRPS